ncbi:hypothetical protein Y919_06335 [Caloranaerobacter azorensis H53214]|uniref:Lipoprotein n=1 Tax=Caloranaerobacter azorensis H53214 TaxID=1156417 RepID=A0A096BGW0_9FIRM|nr:hypothetical protein [Caloranaerobacter azorensis]KGG80430.1 hypothetical protein Y919_06335 [Caloranaerobacter azorensis H53214]
MKSKKSVVIMIFIISILVIVSCTRVNKKIDASKGLFYREGIREHLLNQALLLGSIESNLYFIKEFSDTYSKDELIRRLSYTEGVANSFPSMVTIFNPKDGRNKAVEKLSGCSLELQYETKKFSQNLNKVIQKLIDEKRFDKNMLKFIKSYHEVYSSIAKNYKQLVKENNYITDEEINRAIQILNLLEKDIKKLKELNSKNVA